MSKNKNEKKQTVVEVKKNTTEDNEKVPMSKGEKIFTWVVVSVAALAILVVVLVNVLQAINNKTDDSIANQYENLEENNVYESITYEDIIKKLNNKEEFYLVVANKDYKTENTNCEDAIISINKIAKDDTLGYKVNKIYYINLSSLSTSEQYEIYYERCGKLTRDIFKVPCLIYFTNVSDNYIAKEVSGLYNVESYATEVKTYSDKWDALYTQYFKLCKE